MNESKIAILQVADTGPLESLVVMLRSVGYECYLPNNRLKGMLRNVGCDTVINVSDLVANMGYEPPLPLDEVGISSMYKSNTLYVDVKAHRNYEKVVQQWPNLKNRVLWYRINGGKPEIVPGKGDEVNPPCPILTPNLWYADKEIPDNTPLEYEKMVDPGECYIGETMMPPGRNMKLAPWKEKSYAVWPPFYRIDEYYPKLGRKYPYGPPVCLIHNLEGWGYGKLIEPLKKLGVQFYGQGSPNGLIPHSKVPELLSNALCMIHLKSSDAPGYALYESLAAACPVVCSRRLIWRNRMESLFLPGETCQVFDRETHEPLSDEDVNQCMYDIGNCIKNLSDRQYNNYIGLSGRARLKEVCWSSSNPSDVSSLNEFMRRNFQ